MLGVGLFLLSTASEGKDGGLSRGAMAGLSIGAVLALLLTAGGCLAVRCYRKRLQLMAELQELKERYEMERGRWARSSSAEGEARGEQGGKRALHRDLNTSARESSLREATSSAQDSLEPLTPAGSSALPLTSYSSGSSEGSISEGGSCPPGTCNPTSLLSRIPDDHWNSSVVDLSSIDFGEQRSKLGSGGFGTVYRVLMDGVQPLAAKVLPVGGDPKHQQAFLKEVSILRRLRHRNVVAFAGVALTEEGDGIILMELMEGRDLSSRLDTLNKAGERVFAWHNRGKMVALDVARGIHYVHSKGLTHFDVKANNVLLTRDLTAKLADVGFARAMRHTTHHSISCQSQVGTFSYMAPELLLGRPCSNAIDIFSFGMLLWVICTGERPCRGFNRALRVPEDCPKEVADLFLECTDEDPAKRPSAEQLVRALGRLARPSAGTV